MGGLFKPTKKTTTSESKPWEPQQDYLKQGFSHAQQGYEQALKGLNSIGNPTAGLNQGQLAAIQQGWSGGLDASRSGGLMSQTGANLFGQADAAQTSLGRANSAISGVTQSASNAAQAQRGHARSLSGGAGQMQTIAKQMGNSGHQATSRLANQAAAGFGSAQGAIKQMQGITTQGQTQAQKATDGLAAAQEAGLNNALSGAGQLSGLTASGSTQAGATASDLQRQIGTGYGQAQANGNTILGGASHLFGDGSAQGILSDAQLLSNNPYLNDQINSAVRTVNEGFRGTQAEINAAASGAGGMNSTRAALMESKAHENALRQAGDISSTMRSNAYQQGLGTALGNKQANNAVLGTALNAAGFLQDSNARAFDQTLARGGFEQAANNQAFNQTAANVGMLNESYARNFDQTQTKAGFEQAANNQAFNQTANSTAFGQDAHARLFDQTVSGNALLQQSLGNQLNGLNSASAARQAAASADAAAGNFAVQGQQSALQGFQNNATLQAQLAQLGQSMAQGGQAMSQTGSQAALDFASVLQAQQQNEINNRLALSQQQQAIAQQYMATIGGNYGGTSTQTVPGQSPFQTIVGAIPTIAGAMKGFG
ncbi:hypothetical protein [Paracoccus sp. (in: a-proteobacteria)]|uniref:hypothetical protein n=1 Tax=Paracoccus sp. TaxID=267 RepID=UPI0026E03278|nr:hypothetical protein [Paracoccus sp. (in: a-proteobacteria)]MDO5647375.1 hypothetical protein [Paracoccus sp. (in: a-proteobacteria)]